MLDGKLVLDPVRANDGGIYECQALVVGANRHSSTSSAVRLDVVPHDQLLVVELERHARIRLTCPYQRQQHMHTASEKEVHWRRVTPTRRLSESSRRIGKDLIIVDVSGRDAGIYECFVYSRFENTDTYDSDDPTAAADAADLQHQQHEYDEISVPIECDVDEDTCLYGHFQLVVDGYDNADRATMSHVESHVNANVELECDLEVGDELYIKWHKLNGVSLVKSRN